MTLSKLTTDQITQMMSDAILTGVSRLVKTPCELASLYGYDCSGRYGAVANRIMLVGQKINKEADFDVVGLNFPSFTLLKGYKAV